MSIWGGAVPDRTHCWDDPHFSFDLCCISWDDSTIGRGDESCWTPGFTYELCCPESRTPRDMFSCEDRDPAWSHFRQSVALGTEASSWNLPVLRALPPTDCILGSLVVALADLARIAFVSSLAVVDLTSTFEHAENILRAILRSPISFDEIIQSRWFLGEVLVMIKSLPHVVNHIANELRVHGLTPGPSTIRPTLQSLAQHIESGVGRAGGWNSQLAFASLAEAVAEGPSAVEPEVVGFTSLASALFVRYQFPKLPRVDRFRAVDQVSNYLALGGNSTRAAWMVASPVSGVPKPLCMLLSDKLPFILLLRSLQQEAVVGIDPLDLNDPTLLPQTLPNTWAAHDSRGRVDVKVAEFHIFPFEDGVSNLVRSSRKFFCHSKSTAFVRLILAAAKLADTPQDINIWEVGANLGDCSLWAAAILSARRPGRSTSHLRANIRAFEPILITAERLRYSFDALRRELRRQKYGSSDEAYNLLELIELVEDASGPEALASLPVQVRKIESTLPRLTVVPLALSDRIAQQVIGIPLHSLAESTAHSCSELYAWHGCSYHYMYSDLLDNQIADLVRLNSTGSSTEPLDIVKVHVQGHELKVLLGAQDALSAGQICVLLARVYYHSSSSFAHQAEETSSFLMTVLSNYNVVLVNGKGDAMQLGNSPALLAEWFRQIASQTTEDMTLNRYNEILAWHSGPQCQNRPATLAAEALFGQDTNSPARRILFSTAPASVD